MKGRTTSICAVLALVVLLGGIGFRFFATSQGVPILGADSYVFLPQAISFRERGELINQVWWPAARLDRSGVGRMVYHGFLYPILVSGLMGRADALGLARSLAILQTVATLLVGATLLNFAQVWRWKFTPRLFLLVMLLTAACANYTQGALGRPEAPASIALMLGAIALSRTVVRWHSVIAAVAIGLLGALDPVIAVFGGLLFAGYAAWRFRGPQSYREIGIAAALSIGVFAACFLVYPYSFAEWWNGSWRMSRSAFEQAGGVQSWRNYFTSYLTRGSTWMLAATLPLVVWSGLRMARRGPSSPALFYAICLLGMAAVVRFVFYVAWANYNLLPLMPLGFVAVFYQLGREEINASARSVFRPIAFAILLVASLGFAGDLYERAQTLRFGLTLPAARERFAELRAKNPRALIASHKNLFGLTENYSAVAFSTLRTIPERAEWWLQPQAFTGLQQPPEIDGFRVAENYFNPRRLSFLGIQLWRADRGNGFAVYKRERESQP